MESVLCLFNNKYLCFLFYFKEAEAEIHGQFNMDKVFQESRTPHLRKDLGPLSTWRLASDSVLICCKLE